MQIRRKGSSNKVLSKREEKKKEKREREFLLTHSVLNECPHEQLFVTFGLLILKPEPIRLST